MRLTTTRSITPLALLALVAAGACGKDATPADTTDRDALQRDLALAQSASVSLASANALPRTRFVSALEAGERPTTGTGAAARPARRSPSKAPRVQAERAPPAPSEVASTEAPPAAAEETQMAPAPAPAPAPATEVAQAPTSTAAGGPHEGESATSVPMEPVGTSDAPVITRRGRGRGIGGIIGVVIRGGGVDGDNCERDRPGARGGGLPYPVGRGFPGGNVSVGGVPMSGIGRGTFPGRM